MKIKKRKIRKKELKEDAFSKFIKRFIAVIGEHKKIVLYVISGVLFISIILVFFINSRISINRNANEKLVLSMVLYMQNQIKDAYQNFELLQTDFYGTDAAKKALFFIASIDYRMGEINKAIDEFKKVAKISKDEYLIASSLVGVGQCFEQLGQPDSAIYYYKKAADKYKNDGFKSECLLNLGRVYEGLGRFEEAEDLYKDVLNVVETPGIKEEVQNRLNMLKGLRQVLGK